MSQSSGSASQRMLGYHDESYERYLESLTPCPECGRVDEMDNIERGPFPICAACQLDAHDDEEWDEWGDEEELRS